MTSPFIAVHVGAGFHSDANSKELKALCQEACKQAMVSLRSGLSSTDATALAIAILESSEHTNAGLGSNLSIAGTVECDSSIMDGQGNFGAVGAVGGVVNPVILARAILKESCQGCLSLGRVPPLVLVGEGANLWAKQHHITTCSHDDLITDRARSVYLDHVGRLEGVTNEGQVNGSLSGRMGDGLASHRNPLPRHHLQTWRQELGGPAKKRRRVCSQVSSLPSSSEQTVTLPNSALPNSGYTRLKKSHPETCHGDTLPADISQNHPPLVSESEQSSSAGDTLPVDTKRGQPVCPVSGSSSSPAVTTTYQSRASLDTVGAICLDARGHVAAGVSSGGISLKSPGRVGQAAMFGCGCWAEDELKDSQAVACSTSGTGEYIIKTSLARECALAMADCSLDEALDQRFLQSKQLRGVEQKLAGAIALHLDASGAIHFSWGHTTESMCIGYMVDYFKEPVAIISKMENPQRSGTTRHVQAVRFQPHP